MNASRRAGASIRDRGRANYARRRRDFELHVPAGADPATRIPISVFHRARPGPVLAITAGVHEYEFPFGLRNAVRYSMDTREQIDAARSLTRQAVADGKPTVLVEVGENGRRDPAFVDAIVRGVLNALRVLKMVNDSPALPRPDARDGLAGPPVKAGESVVTIAIPSPGPL